MKEEEFISEPRAVKDALEGMIWQFAYRGNTRTTGEPMLYCGGLSALEDAFSALGWDDPHIIEDPSLECDVEGCHRFSGPSVTWDGMYSMICTEHHSEECDGKPRPKMKETAIKRESLRDKDNVLPGDWREQVFTKNK